MEYIAHIRVRDHKIQTVEEHLLGVMKLAEEYGKKVGLKHVAGLAGMLHDLGKFTEEFRTYIWNAVYHPEKAQRRGEVDHSTAGGKLLYQLFHSNSKHPYKMILAEIVGNAIISHHSYLQDFITPDLTSNYLKRVRDKKPTQFDNTIDLFFSKVMTKEAFQTYVDQAVKELEAFIDMNPKTFAQQCHFTSKYIFSALIDADRTNTRQFDEGKDTEPEMDHKKLFQNYYDKLMNKLNRFKQSKEADKPINRLRAEMSEQCDLFALRPSGIYTLSIPTGGGKTLASLRYALKHALEYGKKRIVYVVPFTTIIEQNAAEVRSILEDEIHILEHHSNVLLDLTNEDREGVEEEKQDGIIDQKHKLKLARDNWESPIIFTTMVQFLNVFYARGNRNTRRLHNLSESVLIFDEVQKVPTACVSLFNEALNFLKNKCHSSIILCTATQPALDFVERKLEIDSEGEIIANLTEVTNAFKRVEIVDEATHLRMDNGELMNWVEEKANEVNSILIILNTKSVTRNLYRGLNKENRPTFHLSTTMCATHRNKVLKEIKQLLKQNKPVICVSTQLIEAGVDVSFECVVRSLAGLDSIAQAAGRCNRHGENPSQKVYLIDHAEEKLDRLEEIRRGKEITRKILRDLTLDSNSHGGDLLSTDAMERYFKEFYTEFKEGLNYFIKELSVDMTHLLNAPKRDSEYAQAYYHQNKGQALPLVLANSYKTAADHFHVISDATTPVLVSFEGGKDIIADLNSEEWIEDLTGLLRQAQHYSVNLFAHEVKRLEEQGALVSFLDGQVLALKEGWYSEEYGVNLEGDSGFGLLIN